MPDEGSRQACRLPVEILEERRSARGAYINRPRLCRRSGESERNHRAFAMAAGPAVRSKHRRSIPRLARAPKPVKIGFGRVERSAR